MHPLALLRKQGRTGILCIQNLDFGTMMHSVPIICSPLDDMPIICSPLKRYRMTSKWSQNRLRLDVKSDNDKCEILHSVFKEGSLLVDMLDLLKAETSRNGPEKQC